jgi:chromosome segregation ATPase
VELEGLSLERVGADVAHETLMALQQENDAAAAALAAAGGELEAARAQIAELEGLQTERAATEEQRAAAETKLQALQQELSSRDARIEKLESQFAEAAQTAEPAEFPERTYAEDHHVLLVPSESGYVTLERPGPAPQQGDTVMLAIGRYEVSRRGTSPFPEDSRGCAYLIHA